MLDFIQAFRDKKFFNVPKNKFLIGDHVQVFVGPDDPVLDGLITKITTSRFLTDYYQYDMQIESTLILSRYGESKLALIAHNQQHLLESWQSAKFNDLGRFKDIDWIFLHTEEVLKDLNDLVVSTLAKCMGIEQLGGSDNKLSLKYENTQTVKLYATPYLRDVDREGWDKFCEVYKRKDLVRPKWTVLYNIVSKEQNRWVGTAHEFFDNDKDAESCKLRNIAAGHCVGKRPFHDYDIPYLGAAHRRPMGDL